MDFLKWWWTKLWQLYNLETWSFVHQHGWKTNFGFRVALFGRLDFLNARWKNVQPSWRAFIT